MPTPTYIALANAKIISNTGSIVFGSIPQTYRDLVLVVSGFSTPDSVIRVTVNDDNGQLYSYVGMGNNAGAPISFSGTNYFFVPVTLSTIPNNGIINFFEYTSTIRNKSVLMRRNESTSSLSYGGVYLGTSAITSLNISASTALLPTGSTYTLYGIGA